MSIATKLGFVIGEKYTVINAPDEDCEVGEVLIFSDDDGSHYPFFENTDGKEVCCYLLAFMSLPQKEVKSEADGYSIEDLIQKRNEAKEALTQAQKVLDEKLALLGLQKISATIAPVSKESFEWVEMDWTEFGVGDKIKVVDNKTKEEDTGTVLFAEDLHYDGNLPLEVTFDLADNADWPYQSSNTFYKKVTK